MHYAASAGSDFLHMICSAYSGQFASEGFAGSCSLNLTQLVDYSTNRHKQMRLECSFTAGTYGVAGFVTIGCCWCQRPPSFDHAACSDSLGSTSVVRPYFLGLPCGSEGSPARMPSCFEDSCSLSLSANDCKLRVVREYPS